MQIIITFDHQAQCWLAQGVEYAIYAQSYSSEEDALQNFKETLILSKYFNEANGIEPFTEHLRTVNHEQLDQIIENKEYSMYEVKLP